MSEMTGRDVMDVLRESGDEQYMRGYKDGFQQGKMIGFDKGIERGLKEIERMRGL